MLSILPSTSVIDLSAVHCDICVLRCSVLAVTRPWNFNFLPVHKAWYFDLPLKYIPWNLYQHFWNLIKYWYPFWHMTFCVFKEKPPQYLRFSANIKKIPFDDWFSMKAFFAYSSKLNLSNLSAFHSFLMNSSILYFFSDLFWLKVSCLLHPLINISYQL